MISKKIKIFVKIQLQEFAKKVYLGNRLRIEPSDGLLFWE